MPPMRPMRPMRLSPAMRVVRAIELQGALADAQRAAEGHGATNGTQGVPQYKPLPPGMKWLATPREALTARHGDARTLQIAFARWLFWRTLLMWRRPTRASAVKMAHRLRGATLWHLAVRLHQEGKPLPLKAGVDPMTVPAWAVSPSGKRTVAAPTVTRDDTPFDPESFDFENADALDALDGMDGMDAIDYWDTFGSGDQYVDLIDPSSLVTPQDWEDAGGVLTFEEILGSLHDFGYTDLDIAGLLDSAWNGQASLWAGQDLFDGAGIASAFDINDPNFYVYLRNQAGYLISGIDGTTRRDIASSLWALLGGGDYFGQGIPVDRVGKALASWFGTELGPSADYRAYMIAVTETARAESWGTFVALYQTGARQKIWIANAGACIYCVTNVEEGAIPLTQSFPGGYQAPPQHPLCRCSLAAALAASFDPNDWMSRNPSDLDPMIFNWSGAIWPNVDFSDLELPGIDEGDFQLAARPEQVRARVAAPHYAQHDAKAAYALGVQLADAVETLAHQWCRDAHVRLPTSEAEIRTLAKRLRNRDELPDAREADEQYLHRLRGAIRDVLTAGSHAKE